ncbi:tyrosine-protein phosphatase [Fulvimarina sp. 2208YS6-2-32]|uniref:Tyrosine-protein phosphatase n=1 Tax=Fulvimarina uroteuthidis TaxID=3098149 RepID=A0ABU5I6N8_9HYPH|nr:tyrosine-protein phosphatase [Fulvimarina sp. 2208YS6-2-32]MDY8110876.1 tyrosine-protein phosphatase [Fulvimarina sp. 2208YS6-2-32]
MSGIRRPIGGFLIAVAVLVAPPAGYAGFLHFSGNVHAVELGAVYRSGQLDRDDLEALIAQKGIKSILNLRGEHPDVGWYSNEADVVRRSKIVHISIGLSAREEPDLATMRRLATVIESAPKPLLIHCMGGADRTGLASAIYEYSIAGKSADEADDQLSVAYGHFPWLWSRTGAMDKAFEAFVAAGAAYTQMAEAREGNAQ